MVLVGSEVKSMRDTRANLQDAYARVIDGEVWLYGMHVAPYPFSHTDPPDPMRRRKLLLHHKEIVAITRATEEKGFTLIRSRSTSPRGGPRWSSAWPRARRNTTSASRSLPATRSVRPSGP